MMHDLTPDELLDANDRCRQYAGKALDQCTVEDFDRVRAGLATEVAFLKIMRDEALLDIRSIEESARRQT